MKLIERNILFVNRMQNEPIYSNNLVVQQNLQTHPLSSKTQLFQSRVYKFCFCHPGVFFFFLVLAFIEGRTSKHKVAQTMWKGITHLENILASPSKLQRSSSVTKAMTARQARADSRVFWITSVLHILLKNHYIPRPTSYLKITSTHISPKLSHISGLKPQL